MKTYNHENINFKENDVYEFDFENFKIYYNEEEWIAESKDSNIDNIFILEDFLNNEIELFDNYKLTKEHFKKLKEKVK